MKLDKRKLTKGQKQLLKDINHFRRYFIKILYPSGKVYTALFRFSSEYYAALENLAAPHCRDFSIVDAGRDVYPGYKPNNQEE